MVLWSLEHMVAMKRGGVWKGGNLLQLSSCKNFAETHSVPGPMSGLAAWQLLAKERTGGRLTLPQPPFPPHPTFQLRTFSISSSGKTGNWLFLWNEHDPKKYSARSAYALEKVLSCTSHHKVFELLFIKAQLEPTAMQSSRRTVTKFLAPNPQTPGLHFYIYTLLINDQHLLNKWIICNVFYALGHIRKK